MSPINLQICDRTILVVLSCLSDQINKFLLGEYQLDLPIQFPAPFQACVNIICDQSLHSVDIMFARI